MAAQALYRRWRPQSFDDVIGQDHITRTLRNAIAGDRLGQAYLFTGPRGTGKTSVARIMAKAVNCQAEGERPCNECSICVAITEGRHLDLVEIDAASNTGVDDVRDLRDKVSFRPNEARYKVYIVDEVHMLSTAAFNALLKTLEEPPDHVIFILATTEPHKIPETILSRCQRHDFKRVSVEAVAGKLALICAAEGVEADPGALEVVARDATGSIRDAESLMDMLIAVGEKVTVDIVRDVLGTAASEAVDGIADALVQRDAALGLRLINGALDRGVDPRQLQNQILEHLRGLLLVQTGTDPDLLGVTSEQLVTMKRQASAIDTVSLAGAIRRFNDAKPSVDRSHPGLPLELALVESVLDAQDRSQLAGEREHQPAGEREHQPAARSAPTSVTPTAKQKSSAGTSATAKPPARDQATRRQQTSGNTAATTEQQASGPAAAVPQPSSEAPPATDQPAGGAATSADATGERTSPSRASKAKSATPSPSRSEPASTGGSAADVGTVTAQWDAIMAEVARDDRNLAALLKDGKPVAVDAEAITIGFFYEFHCRRVAEAKRAEKVQRAIADVTGLDRALRCTVVTPSQNEKAARPSNKQEQASQDPVVRHALDELGAKIASVKNDD